MSARTTATVGRALVGACAANPRACKATVFWTAVSAVPAFLHGHVIARALDDGFLAGDRRAGLGWLAILAVASLIAAVGAARAVRAVGGLVEPFRDRLVEFVVAQTLASATASSRGGRDGAVARLSQQVEMVRGALGATILGLLAFVVTVGSTVAGQSTLAPDALIFIVPPIAVALALFVVTVPVIIRRERALVVHGEQVAGRLQVTMEGLRDIRAAGAAERIQSEVGRTIEDQAARGRAVAWVTAWRVGIIALGAQAPVMAILLGIPWLLQRGASPGEIAGTVTYALVSIAPAMTALTGCVSDQVIPLWVTLGRLLEANDTRGNDTRGNDTRGNDTDAMAAPPAPTPSLAGTGPTSRARPARARVQARHLSFAYGPDAAPVVSNLNLTLEPGEHLAVVGPSGIGKSTLVNLLSGMLVPTHGRIEINGVDISTLGSGALADLRVLIPQEAFVFSGCLAQNVRYLNPGADDTALAWACRAFGVLEPDAPLAKLHTPLRPEELSNGQRQLIALARAYLCPAPLAILDEATCHLDPAAEAQAEQVFAQRRGSLIVVAHRISSALRARRVLVLDGTRAYLGTHHQLLADCPLYRELVGHWSGHPPEAAPPAAAPIVIRS